MTDPVRFQFPTGVVFGAVMADPPWPLEPSATKSYPVTHRMYYDRMPLADICAALPRDIVHPDGHLWLWTTNPALEMALDVVEAWGFDYKTMATWRKSKLGTGWWLRSRTEHMILAARSTALRANPGGLSTEIKGRWRGHSVKPDEAYEFVEKLSPPPYLELFSRRETPRPGWVHLGAKSMLAEPYGQDIAKAGTPNLNINGNHESAGTGGLRVEPEMEVWYLDRIIRPVRVKVVAQNGRKVKCEFPDNVKKMVSIDSLRLLDWKPNEQGRSGRGKVIFEAEKGGSK